MKLSSLSLLLSALAAPTVARVGKDASNQDRALRGNGKPTGPDAKKVFQFNMIGHPKDASIPSCNNNGGRIFVERGGRSDIPVLQGDCSNFDISCSSYSSSVNLVNNVYEICTPELGTFDVYVRILGKPGGQIDICLNDLSAVLDGEVDPADPDAGCLIGTFSLKREGGRSKFAVATNKLFDDDYDDILWTVNTNDDFRNAQFWFYEV